MADNEVGAALTGRTAAEREEAFRRGASNMSIQPGIGQYGPTPERPPGGGEPLAVPSTPASRLSNILQFLDALVNPGPPKSPVKQNEVGTLGGRG